MSLESDVDKYSFLEGLDPQHDYTFDQMRSKLREAGLVWRGPWGTIQTAWYLSFEHDDPHQGTYYFNSRKEGNTRLVNIVFNYK